MEEKNKNYKTNIRERVTIKEGELRMLTQEEFERILREDEQEESIKNNVI
ncbi:hypothetical protein [Clostridium porci]|nr:hypothetical protein [Clostridium porci]